MKFNIALFIYFFIAVVIVILVTPDTYELKQIIEEKESEITNLKLDIEELLDVYALPHKDVGMTAEQCNDEIGMIIEELTYDQNR